VEIDRCRFVKTRCCEAQTCSMREREEGPVALPANMDRKMKF